MNKATHQNGDYRSLLERELDIQGIPTAVVDPHHHVLPFWFHHLQGREPAHLLHIDAHHDMFSDDIPRSRIRKKELIVPYTRYHLHINTFIWAADYFDLLESIYHFDPRKKPVLCSKDYKEGVQARAVVRRDVDGWLCGSNPRNGLVSRPLPVPFSRETVQKRLNESKNPLIVDIDLDAFQSLEPHREHDLPESTYRHRVEKTLDFLAGIRKPILISIARSLHPGPYVPLNRVFTIEHEVMDGLKRIYDTPSSSRSEELPAYPCARSEQLSLPL